MDGKKLRIPYPLEVAGRLHTIGNYPRADLATAQTHVQVSRDLGRGPPGVVLGPHVDLMLCWTMLTSKTTQYLGHPGDYRLTFSLPVLLKHGLYMWTIVCSLHSLTASPRLHDFSRQQVLQTPSFTFNTVDTNASKQDPLQFSAAFTMTGNEIPKSEPTTTSSLAWTTPTSQPRPRPATIHEGFSYSFGDEYTSLQSWDSSSFSFQPTPSECLSRPVSMHQDLCSPTPADRSR